MDKLIVCSLSILVLTISNSMILWSLNRINVTSLFSESTSAIVMLSLEEKIVVKRNREGGQHKRLVNRHITRKGTKRLLH